MTRAFTIPCLKVDQPIGQFYIGVISHAELLEIAFVDQRSMKKDLDDFLGIQRQLVQQRVKQIRAYVGNVDATFPTSIIVSLREENCEWSEETRTMTIFESEAIKFHSIAKILDGQHRIEGLKALPSDSVFELAITIFVEVDVATQANIFATVNLAQTKVNRSLVYDLFSYEKVRSPQKSAHEITVALNSKESSPFYRRIKRLGIATPGVNRETLTQAAMVESLLPYISNDPTEDRNKFLRRITQPRPDKAELKERPFRGLWLEGKEDVIAQILFMYFSAVVERWPESWFDIDRRGNVLPKTNGFKALMRFLKPVYIDLVRENIGACPTEDQFRKYFDAVRLEDSDFNIETFPPGSSGEAILYRRLYQANFG